MDYDLFVIGGGSGGVRCARIAASHGARVAIAEERHWGGTCVNVGCVPKKLMVQAAEYAAWAADSHGFGWNTQPGQHDWAALMQAKDGAATLKKLETTYSEADESAGITPLSTIPPEIQAKLESNLKLFQDLGFEGTPTLMFKDDAGHWQHIEGMPKLSDLPKALHLPEQPVTDPELQRFR